MQLLDTTSDLTRGLLAAAESRHVEDMAGVSPHGHLGSLTTPVYLLHGAGDNIIPSSETLWMAAELPGTTLQVGADLSGALAPQSRRRPTPAASTAGASSTSSP